MHLHYLASIILAALLAVSCSSLRQRPSVDIKISNESTNDLNWVCVLLDEREQCVGVLPAGVWKENLDAGLPKTHKSDTAFVEFVDEKDGWHYQDNSPNSERKLYRIPIDVSALRQISSGHYNVTFSILSFTEAKLQIEKEDK